MEGGGTRTKIRQCTLGRSSIGCPGPDSVTDTCNTQKCPEWTEWTPWTECTVSCGGGQKSRVRECLLPTKRNGQSGCFGDSEETMVCGMGACPDWGEWSDWTVCSKSCGGGQTSRYRNCLLQDYTKLGDNSLGCVGETDQVLDCNTKVCPIWTDWGVWTECSATCGGGSQVRSRDCVLPLERVAGCIGPKDEERTCNSNTCPIWTDWTEWSECSATCGGGTRSKVRQCILPFQRGSSLECDGPDIINEKCNDSPCPNLTTWSEWSLCSQSCGGGTTSRERQCIYNDISNAREAIDNDCLEPLTEYSTCNTNTCPEYTEWTSWTECSRSCGGGVKRKVRECVLTKDANGCQGPSEMETICNTQTCPIWTEWTEWTSCRFVFFNCNSLF